jgi:hypothetical protein
MIDDDKQNTLKSSTDEQHALRKAALWAAKYVNSALPVFEARYPNDGRPREAVEAGRAFGEGGRRDKNLRVLSLAVFKIGKDVDEAAKYVTKAASAVAAIAYTHTDLQTGQQGVRQAQHILGPVVYAAMALEMDAGGDMAVGDGIVRQAAKDAPAEVRYILAHMPPQPKKAGRLHSLFHDLDVALRR